MNYDVSVMVTLAVSGHGYCACLLISTHLMWPSTTPSEVAAGAPGGPPLARVMVGGTPPSRAWSQARDGNKTSLVSVTILMEASHLLGSTH